MWRVCRVIMREQGYSTKRLCELRRAIGCRLREAHGLGEAEINACFEEAPTDSAFDLARVLPPPRAGGET